MGVEGGGAELKGEEGSRFLFPQDLHSVLHSCKVQVRPLCACVCVSLCVFSPEVKTTYTVTVDKVLIFRVNIIFFCEKSRDMDN